MVSITTQSSASDTLWGFKNGTHTNTPFIWTFQIRVFAPASCAAPQEYRCPPRGFHLICTCCLQPMPDRRAELSGQQVAQQCEWLPEPVRRRRRGCRRLPYLYLSNLFFLSPRRSKCNGACERRFIIHAWRDCCANSIPGLRCRMCCVLAGVLCQRSFCHMYWGCQRIGCRGCLAPFSGKCLFQQHSLGGWGGGGGGGFRCRACLLLGNFFNHGSLVAPARIHILGSFSS